MEAEYDQMAEEYDATREVPTPDEVDSIVRAIEGSTSVLDVGVGTGRFALPISQRGFQVTGIDVSRRMLLKAQEKGLENLALGDAYRLPVRDKSFDSCVIIHVLHVVADWRRVMREITRTTRSRVVTILRVPPEVRQFQGAQPVQAVAEGGPQGTAGPGYPVRAQHRMWQNEQELKREAPPTELRRIRDEVVEVSIADAFRRLEAKRPFGGNMVPEEFKQQMMERILAMNEGQVVHRRIVEDLAVWDVETLAGSLKEEQTP